VVGLRENKKSFKDQEGELMEALYLRDEADRLFGVLGIMEEDLALLGMCSQFQLR
jgi:hypothetical protein